MRNDTFILAPYSRGRAGKRASIGTFAVMAVYSVLTGIGVAILPPQLLFSLAVPMIVAIGICLWMLPDGSATIPEMSMRKLLIAFVTVNCLWPSYIALNLPGLPWINPQRLTMFPLFLFGLYSYSTSSTLRSHIRDILNSQPRIIRLFWLFWAITLFTLGLSDMPMFSVTKWLNNQIYWTFLFIAAAWLGTKPNVLRNAAAALVITAILVSIEGMYELSIQAIPWAESIPQWLIGDPELVATILKPHARAGTDIYRVTATFSVSLVFAEYLAILYPIAIHAAIQAKETWKRALMILGLAAMLVAMWITNARSGMIGFFMSILIYGGIAAIRNWRKVRSSLFHVSVVAMLPIFGVIFLGLALTWPRLHNMTFGGAQHQPSSEARDAQWAMGVPKILHNPIGKGAGRGAETLGYKNLAGIGTIDTYYLNLLLEYGVVGFFAFMAIFLGQAITGVKTYFQTDEEDELYSGPIAVSLLIFLVIKSVASSEANIPIIFVLSGFLFSIAYLRQSRRQTALVAPGRSDQSQRR